MIELLVIKAGVDYYRFKDKGSEPCTMQKATVFSLHQIKEVRRLCEQLQRIGISANIVKMTIFEEPFQE